MIGRVNRVLVLIGVVLTSEPSCLQLELQAPVAFLRQWQHVADAESGS